MTASTPGLQGLGVDDHGAKLVAGERPAIATDDRPAVEDGAGRGEPDGQGDGGKDGDDNQQDNGGHRHVERPLGGEGQRTAGAGMSEGSISHQ